MEREGEGLSTPSSPGTDAYRGRNEATRRRADGLGRTIGEDPGGFNDAEQ